MNLHHNYTIWFHILFSGIVVYNIILYCQDFYFVFIGTPQLTSSVLSSSQELCPTRITFMCTATEFPETSLRWVLDDDIIAVYLFGTTVHFPYTVALTTPMQGVVVEVVTATIARSIDFLSTLTASWDALLQLQGQSLTCGGLFSRSNSIRIDFQVRGIHEFCSVCL